VKEAPAPASALPNHAPSVEHHPDLTSLREPLQPSTLTPLQQKQSQMHGASEPKGKAALVRTDSESGGSEEFVDAES
jgi:hypothetical protein